jgi:hypothetical protein
VIPKSDLCAVRLVDPSETRFAWAYFEGALTAPPPLASAGLNISSAAARIATLPVIVARHFMAASVWFEQLDQNRLRTFPIDDSVRRLAVPEGKDDPDFGEAQESITR